MKTPLLPPLAERCRLPEVMDQPDLDRQLHHQALAGLSVINRISRSAAIVWPTIQRAAQQKPTRSLSILDVACGGGDLAIAVKRLAEKSGLSMEVSGCDISPSALEFASDRALRQGVDVRFFRADAIADPLPDRYDIVMCSLFLHHLPRTDAVKLLHSNGQGGLHHWYWSTTSGAVAGAIGWHCWGRVC